MDIQWFSTRTCPAARSGSDASTTWKSLGRAAPCGRLMRCTWRVFIVNGYASREYLWIMIELSAGGVITHGERAFRRLRSLNDHNAHTFASIQRKVIVAITRGRQNGLGVCRKRRIITGGHEDPRCLHGIVKRVDIGHLDRELHDCSVAEA